MKCVQVCIFKLTRAWWKLDKNGWMFCTQVAVDGADHGGGAAGDAGVQVLQADPTTHSQDRFGSLKPKTSSHFPRIKPPSVSLTVESAGQFTQN